ncbi:MAG TPA: hypothetical protein VLL48_13495 [Longimicrobiales bacterium]|nr:hypothetical protein [Longimicrobiales bacterium]
MGRWDLSALRYEPGAWIRATLYPQKCDLSPDGRWLLYSALDYRGDWGAGSIYEAVSRLPWLHALAAWEAGTTYTRGAHFVDEPGRNGLGAPDVGDATPLLRRYGLEVTRPGQFAVERRRGWEETGDSEPRRPGDPWEEGRRVRMRKERPGGGACLEVEGSWAAFRSFPAVRTPAQYTLVRDGKGTDDTTRRRAPPREELLDVQWADWDAGGRLLAATTEGTLRVLELVDGRLSMVFDHDLAPLAPDPRPAPDRAREW